MDCLGHYAYLTSTAWAAIWRMSACAKRFTWKSLRMTAQVTYFHTNFSFTSSTSHSILAQERAESVQWPRSQPCQQERGIFNNTVVFASNKKSPPPAAVLCSLRYLWLPINFTRGQDLPQITGQINRIENNGIFQETPVKFTKSYRVTYWAR